MLELNRRLASSSLSLSQTGGGGGGGGGPADSVASIDIHVVYAEHALLEVEVGLSREES